MALPGPWQLPPVSGVAFADAAWAWQDGGVLLPSDVQGLTVGTGDIGPGSQGHIGSAGVGFFVGGGFFPALRWNYAWTTTDFRRFSTHPRTQFALGWNF